MSSTEPPTGSTPPPGEPTPPPPPPDPLAKPATAATPDQPMVPPPPPPPPAGMANPMPGAPMAAAYGPGSPGNLVDRFLARLIDDVILGIVTFILTIVLVGAILASDASGFSTWIVGFLFSVVAAAINLGYFGYMESSRGQTIGKQVMKLQSFGPDGVSHPTMEQAIRRNLYQGYAALGIIPILGGLLGWLLFVGASILVAVGINSDVVKRQHWFDNFAGGTQVKKVA